MTANRQTDAIYLHGVAGLGIPVMPGILDFRAVRERGERSQAHINSDLFNRRWQGLGFPLHAETGEPPASFPLDCGRLYRAFQGTVQVRFDVTGPLNAEFSGIEQSATVAVGRKGNAVVAPERSETWESRPVSAPASGEKRLEGFIDPAQNILAAREVCEGQTAIGAHGLQLARLIVVVDRLPAYLPGIDSFGERRVVERRSIPQFAVEEIDLGLCGVNAVLVCEPHLPPILKENGNV
jgi:hypothetical protein